MKKFLSSFFVFSLCILGIIPVSAQGLTYPSSSPAGQIDGGYFNMYFKNMLGTCPPGKVLAGFYYNPANKKDTTNGTPFCVSVDGGASYLTGALRGQDGRIPMWSSGGTIFTGSILSQSGSDYIQAQSLVNNGYISLTSGDGGIEIASGNDAASYIDFKGKDNLSSNWT